MPRLTICEGPEVGKTFEFQDECLIGRGLEASVRLHDATVSRKHASIVRKLHGYFIQDLGSNNGTFLNEVCVRHETPLKSGDKIRLGHVLLQVALEDQPSLQPELPQVQIVDTGQTTTSTIVKQIDAHPKRIATQMGATGSVTSLAQAHLRLRTVLSISNTLQRLLSLDQLLPRLVADLFRIFPQAERALVLLKDERTGELTGHVAQTRDGARLERMEISRTILSEVARTKTSVLSADAMGDSRFMKGASVHNLRIRSMMCVPLLFEEELIGAIYMDATRLGHRFEADDLELLTGVGAQAALAVQNALMHERLLRRQRTERDLQFAHEVQKGFLPDAPPQVAGFKFSACYSAAQVVGGDFYDFIETPPESPSGSKRIGIVVGDVSGKGVSAALLMARLMSDVRYAILSERRPADAVARINENFTRRSPEGSFVTLMYVLLDPLTRRIEAVNAGHPEGLIRRATGEVERIPSGVNFPLGLKTDAKFTALQCELRPGDTVALFTDGVTEAMNARGQQYGLLRLEQVLRSSALPPDQLMARILDDIDNHVGAVAPSDDLTLVCFGPTAEKDTPSLGTAVARP